MSATREPEGDGDRERPDRATALVRVDDPERPEPEGDAWVRSLDVAPLALVDFEMTGTDPVRDRICELAVVRFEGRRELDRFVSLVHAPAVGASEAVHGISDDALRDAPALASLRERFRGAVADAIVVGHRVGFDLAFWAAATARRELDAPPAHAIDTRALARRAWHRGSFGLAALAAELGLEAPAHRAEPDARACAGLFWKLAEALRAGTPRHLWQAQRRGKPIRFRDDVEETLRDAARDGRRVRIAYRVPGRDAFVDELEVHRLDTAHVEGRLVQKGIVKTLRGDRLLWAELV